VATELPELPDTLAAAPSLPMPVEAEAPPLAGPTGRKPFWRRNTLAIGTIALLVAVALAAVVRWQMPDDQ
jgi:hypothetical protein